MSHTKLSLKDEEEGPHQLQETAEGPLVNPASTHPISCSFSNSLIRSRNLSQLSFDETLLAELELLEEPRMTPPVNMASLKELEIEALQKNIQVMHDLMMEPCLKLKRNRVAREDLQKVEQTTRYWMALQREIDLVAQAQPKSRRPAACPRLGLLLREIKAIIQDMHPKSDRVRHDLEHYFDVDLMEQEMQAGCFHLAAFIAMLSDLLRANCAPCRDPLIEELSVLAQGSDVLGCLRHCLDILEFMKLDLANYHLSKLRPSAAAFVPSMEREHFEKVTESLGLNYSATKEWLQVSERNFPAEEGPHRVHHIYANSMIDLVLGLSSDLKVFPETMILDEIRVGNMRTDSQDLCVLSCMLSLYNQSVKRAKSNRLVAENAEKLKLDCRALLKADHSELSDLSRALAINVEKALETTMKVKDREMLGRMVDNLVDPESKYYKTIEVRLAEILRAALKLKKTDIKLNANGFKGLTKELGEFTGRFVRLVQVNWEVHGETYAFLYNGQKQ